MPLDSFPTFITQLSECAFYLFFTAKLRSFRKFKSILRISGRFKILENSKSFGIQKDFASKVRMPSFESQLLYPKFCTSSLDSKASPNPPYLSDFLLCVLSNLHWSSADHNPLKALANGQLIIQMNVVGSDCNL